MSGQGFRILFLGNRPQHDFCGVTMAFALPSLTRIKSFTSRVEESFPTMAVNRQIRGYLGGFLYRIGDRWTDSNDGRCWHRKFPYSKCVTGSENKTKTMWSETRDIPGGCGGQTVCKQMQPFPGGGRRSNNIRADIKRLFFHTLFESLAHPLLAIGGRCHHTGKSALCIKARPE